MSEESDFMIAMRAAVKAFKSAGRKLNAIEDREGAMVLSRELERFVSTTISTLGEKYEPDAGIRDNGNGTLRHNLRGEVTRLPMGMGISAGLHAKAIK